jgi:hypothetical protein
VLSNLKVYNERELNEGSRTTSLITDQQELTRKGGVGESSPDSESIL